MNCLIHVVSGQSASANVTLSGYFKPTDFRGDGWNFNVVICVFLSAFLSVERTSLQASSMCLCGKGVLDLTWEQLLAFLQSVMSSNPDPATSLSTGYGPLPRSAHAFIWSTFVHERLGGHKCFLLWFELHTAVPICPVFTGSTVNTDSKQACNALRGRRPGQE